MSLHPSEPPRWEATSLGEAPGERGELPRMRRMPKEQDSPEWCQESEEEEDPTGTSEGKLKFRKEFIAGVAEICSEKMTVKEVAWQILSVMPDLRTRFGRFRQEMKKGSEASGPVAADLLPISLEAVENFMDIKDDEERDWVLLMCWSLNFLYCTGWEKPAHLRHSPTITIQQKQLLWDHLLPAVRRMCEGNPVLPSRKKIKEELRKKGYGYDGSSWVVMEDLEAEKVIPCWPTEGDAAVQPLVNFLDGRAKEMVETPGLTLKEACDWPEKLPQSYVRATDEEWSKLVAAGYKLGLFHHCPDEEVLRTPSGEKVLNGAGGVPKIKGDKVLQRFISILCPLNAVSTKIEGDEGTLPYVGQVSLLNVPEDGVIVIDSEDLQSAFNLFETNWMARNVRVPGQCLGLETSDMVWVSLRTVPMGWVSAVGVVQQAIRSLALKEAGIDPLKEVQKEKEMPRGDSVFLYLDSVDQLQVVSKAMAKIREGRESTDHERFERVCEKHGLPRNASKKLAGAMRGTLQGGELRGDEGIFMLQREKMIFNIGACLVMLGEQKWVKKDMAGVIGRLIFAGAFRRPLMSAMSKVFSYVGAEEAGNDVTDAAYDEVLLMIGLLPLAFTNVRAFVSNRCQSHRSRQLYCHHAQKTLRGVESHRSRLRYMPQRLGRTDSKGRRI